MEELNDIFKDDSDNKKEAKSGFKIDSTTVLLVAITVTLLYLICSKVNAK